jgi:UvrD/REP helicase N-terminal domain
MHLLHDSGSPPTMSISYLDKLNPQQRRAVEHGGSALAEAGPLLIIAGAGSGKTNTLAHRVAHLIVNGADPRRIMLLTFSRRAAAEMMRRVERIVANVMHERAEAMTDAIVWAGTFGEFGQKSFATRVAGRNLRKLYEVALADGGILVDALEMRRVPAADEIEFGGPARRLPVHKLYGVNKRGPILRCGRRRCELAQSAHWVALLGHSVEHTCGSGGPGAGQKLDHAEPRDAVARVFSPAQERQHVFDVRGLKELQAAELHEWNVSPSQFHLQGAAVMGGAEQNGLRFECEPRLAVFQDLLNDVPRLIRFIADADQLGPLGGVALRPKVLSKALFREIDHSVCRR